MKKLILIATILFAVSNLSAQIRFGVKAGANFSTLYVSGDRTGINSEQYNGRFSYHFGAVMEYPINEMFSIQPEFMYLNHGANLKKNNSFSMTDGHITLNTLQLPINVKAKFPIGKNQLFVYGGPYLSYHVYGKAAGKINGEKQDIEIFKKNDDMKRLDYGIGVGVGMEINKFTIGLGNQFGLADINGASGSKMKTGNLSVSVGYFF